MSYIIRLLNNVDITISILFTNLIIWENLEILSADMIVSCKQFAYYTSQSRVHKTALFEFSCFLLSLAVYIVSGLLLW